MRKIELVSETYPRITEYAHLLRKRNKFFLMTVAHRVRRHYDEHDNYLGCTSTTIFRKTGYFFIKKGQLYFQFMGGKWTKNSRYNKRYEPALKLIDFINGSWIAVNKDRKPRRVIRYRDDVYMIAARTIMKILVTEEIDKMLTDKKEDTCAT